MNSKVKFGTYEAASIALFLIITKIFFTTPGVIVRNTGTAGWYVTILSCLFSIALFSMIVLLMKRFPGQNLIDIFEKVLGKFVGKTLSIIICAYLIFYTAINLRQFTEMIKSYNLPYTPPSIILGAFMLTVLLLVFKGITGIARVSNFFIVPVIIGILFILLYAMPTYQLSHIKPYLGYGVTNSLSYSLLRTSDYAEIVIFAILMSSSHSINKIKRVGFTTVAIAGALFSLTLLCYTMVFQYKVGSEFLMGMFQMSRLISLNRYFQRIESIFLFIWVFSSVIAIAASFYTAIIIYCKSLNISDYKPITLPFSFLVFMVAILPESISTIVDKYSLLIWKYGWSVLFAIPLIVLIVSLITGKRGEKLETGNI